MHRFTHLRPVLLLIASSLAITISSAALAGGWGSYEVTHYESHARPGADTARGHCTRARLPALHCGGEGKPRPRDTGQGRHHRRARERAGRREHRSGHRGRRRPGSPRTEHDHEDSRADAPTLRGGPCWRLPTTPSSPCRVDAFHFGAPSRTPRSTTPLPRPTPSAARTFPGRPAAIRESSPAEAPEEFIHIHNGIHGVGDLEPADHDWRGGAARITVRRIR